MDLSIVIPVYNEQKKIAQDIQAACSFLQSQQMEGEIIVVDDGSCDQTAEEVERVGGQISCAYKIIRYDHHRGKGYAVRKGMKETRGRYTMFVDSGLCVPFRFVMDGLYLIQKKDVDLAHGSRRLKESLITSPQPKHRQLINRIFHWIFIRFLNIPEEITDTQCGFKIYRGDVARKLYKRCQSNGFLFDVEMILWGLHDGYHIQEFPVEWCYDADTRLYPWKNLPNVLGELITIYGWVRRKHFVSL
jgi:dolichyl-phosphate beta-glucosyltransferase